MASYITTHSLAIKKIQTTDGAQHAVDAKYWDGEEFNKDLFKSTVETHVIDTSKSTGSKLRVATSSTTKTVIGVTYSDINAVWGEDEAFSTEIWNLFHNGDTFLNKEQGYTDWWIASTVYDASGNPETLTLQAVETGMNHYHGITRTSTTFKQISGVTTSNNVYATVGSTVNVITGVSRTTTTKPTSGAWAVTGVVHSGTWTPSITIADGTAGGTGVASPQHYHTYYSTVVDDTANVLAKDNVTTATLKYAVVDSTADVMTSIPDLVKVPAGHGHSTDVSVAGTVASTTSVTDALSNVLDLCANTTYCGVVSDSSVESVTYVTSVNYEVEGTTSEYSSVAGNATDSTDTQGEHNHGGSFAMTTHSHTVTIALEYIGNVYQNATSAETETVTEVTTAAEISAAAALAAADNLAICGAFFASNVLSFGVAAKTATTSTYAADAHTLTADGEHSHTCSGHSHSLNSHTHTYVTAVGETQATSNAHYHSNITVATGYSTSADTEHSGIAASTMEYHTHNANTSAAGGTNSTNTTFVTGYSTTGISYSGTGATVSLGIPKNTTKTGFIKSCKYTTVPTTLKLSTANGQTTSTQTMTIGAESSDYELPAPTINAYRGISTGTVYPASNSGAKPVVTVSSSKYTVYTPNTKTGSMVTD